MITALAPLGATHNIVLTLAYGGLPPVEKPVDSTDEIVQCIPPASESRRQVTVTAYLKPKGDGEPKTLQFTGPVIDVEKEIAEKLPIAVTKLVEHVSSLEQLDSALAAEKKAAQEATAKKIEAAKKDAAKPVQAPYVPPKKLTSKQRREAAKAEKKKPVARSKRQANGAKGSAADALASLKATAAAEIKATDAAPQEPAPTAEPDLSKLAAQFEAGAVDL
jgi:hypothetical protein